MAQFLEFLKGKKSYILAIGLFAYTLGGWISGHMTAQDALGLIFSSGVIASLRGSIASHQHAVNEVIDVLNTVKDMSNQAPTVVIDQPEATAPTVENAHQ